MTAPFRLNRALVILSSLTLVAAYLWHSHVTPNSPPPDPLGLSAVEYGKPKGSDLRIISSKVINQPIFSVRKVTYSFSKPGPFPGSEDVIVNVEMPYFRIEGGLPTFNLFDATKPPAPMP